MKSNRNMLVIFDELFRGTNVKDAMEGSLAVISAFLHVTSCFFAISTHIVEIAERLQDVGIAAITIHGRKIDIPESSWNNRIPCSLRLSRTGKRNDNKYFIRIIDHY